ncbi:unnamed protein product [Sphagnum tenellum]
MQLWFLMEFSQQVGGGLNRLTLTLLINVGFSLANQDAIANAKICDFADKINMRKDGSEMVTWTKVDGVILVITQAQSPQITHTPYVLCSSCRLSDRDTEEMDMWCNNTWEIGGFVVPPIIIMDSVRKRHGNVYVGVFGLQKLNTITWLVTESSLNDSYPYSAFSSHWLTDRAMAEMDMWCNVTLGIFSWRRGFLNIYLFRNKQDLAMFILAFSGYSNRNLSGSPDIH